MLKSLKIMSETVVPLTKLLDKTVAMLSTKDPMSFQAIQAMNSGSAELSPVKDNSDAQDEVDIILATRGGLTPDERDYYSEEHGITF
jgi:hypothetical protein